ncbi:helicase associated domain-containing protein [Streptomyces luteolus]|uniref:Helicase associated domain-containing protein n=1 Tax=Streptomyces luteolus TaxID=3043615 RepID=A0ABT6TB50_9ACTN|nr:helicase associated domain-containing protein [Streptomyces sp. B-S-A12]MDI3424239.1 helicase associated domain-containing protein [Streptomyces sp. B-S-A12]
MRRIIWQGRSHKKRGRGIERMPLYTLGELQQMAQEWVALEYQQTPDAGLRDPFRPHVELSPNDMYAAQVARSGYRPVPLPPAQNRFFLLQKWVTPGKGGFMIDYRTYQPAAISPAPQAKPNPTTITTSRDHHYPCTSGPLHQPQPHERPAPNHTTPQTPIPKRSPHPQANTPIPRPTPHPPSDHHGICLSGIEACARYVKETGAEQLRAPYDYVTPDDWSPAGFPLGTWLATQRKTYKAGGLDVERVAELDALGMVWSHQDVAFEEGLAAAREWASEHGHFLPPVTAVWNDYPVGNWAKNQRAAAKLADEVEARRAAGLPVESAAGALTQERREALEEIDPGWSPAWDVGWQRCFRLTQAHVAGGGSLPTAVGEVVVQGEDLGRWVTAQRYGFEELQPAQQWLLANVLGLEAAGDEERPVKRTQDHKWMLNLAAARQYQAREGHLNVPRKHVEELSVEEAGPAASGRETTPEGMVPVALGMWVANVRRRATKLTAERRGDLDQLGMRW